MTDSIGKTGTENVTRSIPFASFRGTHFSCFEDLGKQFKELINMVYQQAIGPMFEEWCQKHPQIYEKFHDKIVTYYPSIDQEIKGLSSGTGLSYKQIFGFQLINECGDWDRLDFGGIDPIPDGHCSDIIINTPKHSMIGHNEDNSPEQDGSFFLLDITLLNEEDPEQVKERICYFMFPAILPGWTYGFNSHGIIMTGNSLIARKYEEDGIPFFAITRSLLSATSLDECITLLHHLEPKGVKTRKKSIGFGVNIASTKEMGRMICAEFCTQKTGVYEIPMGSCFGRTNNYEILKDRYYLTGPNSKARKDRIDEMIKETKGFVGGVKDVRDLLGDTKNGKDPVYRKKEKGKDTFTNTSVIFDLGEKKMMVFSANPKESEPIFVFDVNKFEVVEDKK